MRGFHDPLKARPFSTFILSVKLSRFHDEPVNVAGFGREDCGVWSCYAVVMFDPVFSYAQFDRFV